MCGLHLVSLQNYQVHDMLHLDLLSFHVPLLSPVVAFVNYDSFRVLLLLPFVAFIKKLTSILITSPLYLL